MTTTPLAIILLLAGLLVPPLTMPQNPCSHTGTTQTAAANLITTAKSTDCDGNGILDCGYEEISWPAIFGCAAAGSMKNHCCYTFIGYSQKRVFACNGQGCATAGWVNDQPFTQAQPVACVNGQNAESCTR
jgi:hypothetical protein